MSVEKAAAMGAARVRDLEVFDMVIQAWLFLVSIVSCSSSTWRDYVS